jgi:hypothetical protein
MGGVDVVHGDGVLPAAHPSEDPWYDNEREWSFFHAQLKSTTHVDMPAALDLVLNHIMDHPAHHADPSIPLYELAPSQRLLERAAPEDSVSSFGRRGPASFTTSSGIAGSTSRVGPPPPRACTSRRALGKISRRPGIPPAALGTPSAH